MNLAGRLILITRPQPGCDETAQLIVRYGGQPLVAPVMVIQPPLDGQPLADAISHLEQFDGVLLTSTNSAQAFIEAMPVGVTPPPLFAVGQKTARIVRSCGWSVTVPDQPVGGEVLGAAIMQWHPQARHFLFPRAEEGREELHQLLEQAGKKVTVVTAYRTVSASHLSEEVLSRLSQVDAITFFSSRTVEMFLDLLSASHHPFPSTAVMATLSPQIAQVLWDRDIPVEVIAARPDSEALLQGLMTYWETHPAFKNESPDWPD